MALFLRADEDLVTGVFGKRIKAADRARKRKLREVRRVVEEGREPEIPQPLHLRNCARPKSGPAAIGKSYQKHGLESNSRREEKRSPRTKHPSNLSFSPSGGPRKKKLKLGPTLART